MSLEELEKAAETPEDSVELQKDVVRRHWKECTIRDALWHVRGAWREVTANCIRGAWKKLCPDLAIDFGGFDISEGLSRERLKCLEVAKTIGLEMEEDDVESLLESIGEELTTEDLDDLEQQRRRLEEDIEAGQQPLEEGDDDSGSPGVLRHDDPHHGLHREYGSRLREVGAEEAENNGGPGIL